MEIFWNSKIGSGIPNSAAPRNRNPKSEFPTKRETNGIQSGVEGKFKAKLDGTLLSARNHPEGKDWSPLANFWSPRGQYWKCLIIGGLIEVWGTLHLYRLQELMGDYKGHGGDCYCRWDELAKRLETRRSVPAKIKYPYIWIYGQTASIYLNLWVKLAM
jgi:hypothetical protein